MDTPTNGNQNLSEMQIGLVEPAEGPEARETKEEKLKRQHREASKRYLQKHPDRRRKTVQMWRTKNPASQRRSSRKHYWKNPELERQQARNRYHANPKLFSQLSRKWYAEHRDEIRKARKMRWIKLKNETFAAYGGPICKCCGETTFEFLSIDHIEGGGGRHRATLGGSGTKIYYWLKENGFPSGYQVLCFMCNWAKGKHNSNGACPHTLLKTPIDEWLAHS